mgnify:CR=1 FL=1
MKGTSNQFIDNIIKKNDVNHLKMKGTSNCAFFYILTKVGCKSSENERYIQLLFSSGSGSF